LNISSSVARIGPHGNGFRQSAREIDAVEYVANDLGDMLCGRAFGVFFLHAASDKLFQL
jgi:hypothetical protein